MRVLGISKCTYINFDRFESLLDGGLDGAKCVFGDLGGLASAVTADEDGQGRWNGRCIKFLNNNVVFLHLTLPLLDPKEI